MTISNMIPRQLLVAACGGLLVLCAGCDPKDWICWAPDGQHGFVRGADDTWLIDSSGTILGRATDARAWLPDSRRVLAVRAVKPSGWDEYATLLGPARTEKTTKAAAQLLELTRNYQGDPDKFGESAPYKEWESAEIGNTYNGRWLVRSAALYLKHANPQAIAPFFKTATDEDNFMPDIYEVIIRNVLPADPPAEQLLARLPDEVGWVCASPNGEVMAFAVEEPQRPALYVITQAANGHPVRVDEGATEADWSADGQNLVYAKTTVPYSLLKESMQLGTVTSRRVCGPDGQRLAAVEPPKDLVGVILGQNSTRVACLPDGRILFAAAPIRLPAVTTDAPSHLTLFAIRPGATPTLESVVRPEAISRLPDRVDRFTLSPDKKRAAILDGQGRVSIVSLDTGEVVPLQEANPYPDKGDYTQLIPNWRNASEVTCIVPAGDRSGSRARMEVVLANLSGQQTAISKSWPDAMVKGLLLPGQ